MTCLKLVQCDLCGSSRHSAVYARPSGGGETTDMHQVVECDDCGLGFLNPQPEDRDMGRYYYEGYYDWLADADHSERMRAEAAYLPPVSAFPAVPRLLDIGCGAGTFPRHMADLGWEVAGVEPYCPIAIDDFPVHRKRLTEVDETIGTFDAVTAWAVLEHVPQPSAYFERVAELLNPGGVFVFLVTNFESLSSKRLFQEDVPRHCVFFSKRTVMRYLEQAGLRLESVRYGDDVYSMGARGALNYLFCRYVLRRPYTWADYPASFPDFLAKHRLQPGLAAKLRFALRHPVTTLDRFCEPLFDRWQKMTGTYGMATYVARKASD